MPEPPASEPHNGPASTAVTAGETHTELATSARAGRDGLPGLEPDRTVDDWGRSERVTALADATVLGFLYHYWFRVEVEGLDNVPTRGGALLVANRAGRLPADGAMIAKAVREEHRAARRVHLAAAHTYSDLPGLGMALTKLGAVSSHPANLHRLLFDEQELVLLFPEGAGAAEKPLRLRYRVRRFDGAPFVEAAMRARAPLVPVAVLGAEEAMPALGALTVLGRRLRIPPAGALPLPAKLRLRFLEPVSTNDLGPAPWRDRDLVRQLGEEIRRLIQENLFELVAQRRSVWLG